MPPDTSFKTAGKALNHPNFTYPRTMDLTADRLSTIAPSMTLSVTSRAAEMKAAGEDICSLGAGEPDIDTPDHIKAAAISALEQGATKYTAAAGLPALREAIVNKLATDNGLEYDVSQISVNCGAKHSLFNAILAVCDPGDEVIVPSPYWTSYPEMIRVAGAIPVMVETDEKNGWKLTAEQFEDNMSIKTKMIILNSPSNPTGAVYTREELEAIGEVALSEDIVILSDEIYEKLVYGETKHVSIASISQEIKDLTVVVNGFSKAYAMTGWRLGYTAAPPKIAQAISNVQSHSTSAPTTFAQYGAIAALMGDQTPLNDMREELDMRRKYMLSRLNRIHNVTTLEPKGAFYFTVNIRKIGLKSVNFSDKLLSRYKVAVVPGIAFGNDYTVRLSYATSLDVIKEALDRFEDFCRSY